jgi:hypothetical protein
MFGAKREDMRGRCREQHNADLYDFFSPNIINMNRRRSEIGRACSMPVKEENCILDICGGNFREGDNLEDLDIEQRIILNCKFEKWDTTLWIVFNLADENRFFGRGNKTEFHRRRGYLE